MHSVWRGEGTHGLSAGATRRIAAPIVVSCLLQRGERAQLRQEPRARVCSSRRSHGHAASREPGTPGRLLDQPSLRGLRRDRHRGPRIRSRERKDRRRFRVRERRPELGTNPQRDRAMRGPVRQLPSSHDDTARGSREYNASDPPTPADPAPSGGGERHAPLSRLRRDEATQRIPISVCPRGQATCDLSTLPTCVRTNLVRADGWPASAPATRSRQRHATGTRRPAVRLPPGPSLRRLWRARSARARVRPPARQDRGRQHTGARRCGLGCGEDRDHEMRGEVRELSPAAKCVGSERLSRQTATREGIEPSALTFVV